MAVTRNSKYKLDLVEYRRSDRTKVVLNQHVNIQFLWNGE
jgi:hypothetical protein